jgi:hypothetical protein
MRLNRLANWCSVSGDQCARAACMPLLPTSRMRPAVAVAGHHLHVHGQTLHGAQPIATAAGMGIVALGAGVGLLRRRAVQA